MAAASCCSESSRAEVSSRSDVVTSRPDVPAVDESLSLDRRIKPNNLPIPFFFFFGLLLGLRVCAFSGCGCVVVAPAAAFGMISLSGPALRVCVPMALVLLDGLLAPFLPPKANHLPPPLLVEVVLVVFVVVVLVDVEVVELGVVASGLSSLLSFVTTASLSWASSSADVEASFLKDNDVDSGGGGVVEAVVVGLSSLAFASGSA